ncbi:MAG: hypothetical protein JKY46_10380 [Robiginitomaculum sp.]|nr:hypothetical protein [Robiginitomaculum sp.]
MSFIKSFFKSTSSPVEFVVASNNNIASDNNDPRNPYSGRPHLTTRRLQRRERREQRAA